MITRLFPSCWRKWWQLNMGTIRRPAPRRRSRAGNRLGVETLEDRVVPAATMVFGGLEFMTTGTFSTSNNVVTSTSPVQVGVNPAKGAAFNPLLQLDSGVQFTTTDTTGTFSTTGTVSGLAGGDTLQLLDAQMHTFKAPALLASSYYNLPTTDTNVPHLTVGGGDLAVTALHLTASELDLQGALSESHLAGVTVAVQGNTHVVLNSGGVSVAGPDPSVAGPDTFTKDGVTISVQNLDVHVDQTDNALDISGQGSVTIDNNTLSLTLGNTTTPGLVIANGDLQSLLATIAPPKGNTGTQFMEHGLSFTLSSATFSYDQATASFGIGADATFAVGDQSVEVKLGDSGTPGIVIQNGALASLDGSITTDLKIHGLSIHTEDLAVHYVPNSDLSITGEASFEFDGQKIELALGSTGADGTSYPGIDIDPMTGQLLSLDAGISSDITISSLTFKADDLGVHYAPGADFTIHGKAEFDLKDENSSSPDQMVTVMLGSTDSDGTMHPGIDINSSGQLVSLDAAITTDITVAGLEIKADGLGIMYQAGNTQTNSTVTPADSTFVIFGSASFTLDDHTVSLKLGGSFSPGLVIQAGQLQSLEAGVSGDFDLLGLQITAQDLTVAYVAPSNGNAEQIAVFGQVAISSSVFNFSTTLGDEANPGILVVGGQLQSLNITVDGGFSLGSFSFAANGLMIQYSSAMNQLELSGGVMLQLTSSIEVSASLSQGGLLINTSTGALSIDTHNGLNIMASAQFGPFAIKNLDIAFSNGPNGINFHASGEVDVPGGIKVDLTELDIQNGQLADIGVDIMAPIPIGDTGFFLDEFSGDLKNLNNPSLLEIDASATITFGDPISVPSIPGIFSGGSFALVSATGSIAISSTDLELSGSVSLLGGLLGQGSASIDLNWGTGVYMVSGNFSMFDDIISFGGSLTITNQGDISLIAMASINVPPQIPFIGGDSLGNINFALNYIPGDWTDSYVAAWTSVNLFVTSFTIGFKVDFQGDFSIINGSDVAAITAPPPPTTPQPSQFVYSQPLNIPAQNTPGAQASGSQVTISTGAFVNRYYPTLPGIDTVTNSGPQGTPGHYFSEYQLSHPDVILSSLTFTVTVFEDTEPGGVVDGTGTFDANGNLVFTSSDKTPLVPTGAYLFSDGVLSLQWAGNPGATQVYVSYTAADADLELYQNTNQGMAFVKDYSIDPVTNNPSDPVQSAIPAESMITDKNVSGAEVVERNGQITTQYSLSHAPADPKTTTFSLYSGGVSLGTGYFDATSQLHFTPSGLAALMPTGGTLIGYSVVSLDWAYNPGVTEINVSYATPGNRVIDINLANDSVPGGIPGSYVIELVAKSIGDPGINPSFAQSDQYQAPIVSFASSPSVSGSGALTGTLGAAAFTPAAQQAGDTSTAVSLYYSSTDSTKGGTLIETLDYDTFTHAGQTELIHNFSWNGFANLRAGSYYVYAVISDGQNAPQTSPVAGPFTTTGNTPTFPGASFLGLTPGSNGTEQGVFSAASGTALLVGTQYANPVAVDLKVNGGGVLIPAGSNTGTNEFTGSYSSAAGANAALDRLQFVADSTFSQTTTLTFTATVTINGTTYTNTETVPLLTPNTHLVVNQTVSGTVSAVTLTNGGSTYEFAPTVIFTSADGKGSGAAAIATIKNGQVVGIAITSMGTGYDEPPLVSFSDGDPLAPATATATIVTPPADPTSVYLTITVTNPGGPDAQDGTNVQVQNYLTPGLTVLSTNASQGGFDPNTGIWMIGNLAIGAAPVTLTLTVQAGANTFDTPLTSTVSANSTLFNYPAGDAQSVTNILPIANGIVLTQTTLPPAVYYTNYSLALSADRGGGGPYTYALDTAIETDYSGFLPSGLTLGSNGVLSGQPLYVGIFSFSVIVTNSYGGSATVPLQLDVAFNALWLTGTSYTIDLDNTPGSSFFVKYGTLPPGMNIVIDSSGEGTVTGMPTTPGYYDFTISQSVNGAHAAIYEYTVVVEPPVTLTPNTLPPAALGSNYSEQLTAGGGSGIYTYTTTELPDGLTLSPTGLLSGTISSQATPGNTTFTVTIADTLSLTASETYNFTIEPAVLVPLEAFAQPPATLPSATIGSLYSQTLSVNGDSGSDYTFALASGHLPVGLTLLPSGVLSGTIPLGTLLTSANFSVTATDPDGNTFSQTFSLAVNAPVRVTPSNLADGEDNTAYSQTLTAIGGSGTGYTFAVTAGALPTGLSLAMDGLLGGTIDPAAKMGYYSFTIKATDSTGDTGSVNASLFVDAAITVGPANLPDAKIGTPYTQQFSAKGGSGMGYTFAVTAGSLPAGLTLLTSGSLSGTVPPTTPPGSYDFTVTATDSAGASSSCDCSLNVDALSETWTGAVSTAWSNPANWSLHIVPGLGVNVTIPSHPTNGRCPVLDVSASVDNLTLQAGATLTLSGHGLSVHGTAVNQGTIIAEGNEAVTLADGNDTKEGTWEFVGDGIGHTLTIPDFGSTDYFNLVVSDSHKRADTFQTGTDLVVNGKLAITCGTFAPGSSVTAGGVSLSSTGVLDAPAVLSDSGTWTVTGGTFNPDNGTGYFTAASGTQTLVSGGRAFYNLTHSGAGTLSLATNGLTLNGALTNSAGAFQANSLAVTVAGATTLSGGTFKAGSAVEHFNHGLTLNGGNFAGSSGAVTAAGVTITAGTLTAPTSTLSDSGDWSISGGTFNANNGTVALTRSNQHVNGNTTFHNLTKTVTSADTLTFQAGATETVTGTLTLKGANASKLLALRSSTLGQTWDLDVLHAALASFVDVQDGIVLGKPPITASHSHNSGDDTGWKFV